MRLVEDAVERHLEVAETPARIVSLSASVTELLVELGCGERVVGCTRAVEPERVPAARRIGREDWIDQPTLDALAADLVIAVEHENRRRDVDALAARGLPVYVARVSSVEEAAGLIAEIGDLVDAHAPVVERLAAAARQGVEETRRLAPDRPVRVFCALWREPWITAARDGYLFDALVLAGAHPVPEGRFHRRGPRVSLDEVAAARPSLILHPDAPPFGAHERARLAAIAPVRAVDAPLLTRLGPARLPALAAVVRDG